MSDEKHTEATATPAAETTEATAAPTTEEETADTQQSEEASEDAEKKKAAKKEKEKDKKAKQKAEKKKETKADKSLRNLIVNHVAAGCKEEDLKKIFSEFGDVESAKIVLNRATGESMKYAFVIYRNPESVPKAIKIVNGRKDVHLRVAYAAAPGQPKGTEGKHESIYLSGFEETLDKDAIRKLFDPFGEVLEVKLMDSTQKKFAKGVAFVKFAKVSEAESAIVNMNGKSATEGGPKIVVKYSDKPISKQAAAGVSQLDPLQATLAIQQQQAMACMQEMSFYLKQLEEQGRSTELYSLVAVSNLPTDCTETLLWTIYGQFGAIESLVMPQYPNGACRGIAFVHYVNEMSAYNASQSTQGQSLGGCTLQVSCQARMQHHSWLLGDLEARIHGHGGIESSTMF